MTHGTNYTSHIFPWILNSYNQLKNYENFKLLENQSFCDDFLFALNQFFLILLVGLKIQTNSCDLMQNYKVDLSDTMFNYTNSFLLIF